MAGVTAGAVHLINMITLSVGQQRHLDRNQQVQLFVDFLSSGCVLWRQSVNRQNQNSLFLWPRDGRTIRWEAREKKYNYHLLSQNIYEESSLGDEALICRVKSACFTSRLADPQCFPGSAQNSAKVIFIHDEAHQREAWATRQINWGFPLNILNVNI